MNLNPSGYGSTWQKALYRGFPASVPDIVKKYPRAPRSTVSPYTPAQDKPGMRGLDVSITLGAQNTVGDLAVQQALDNIYYLGDPSNAMVYLNDPTISLTDAQRSALSAAITSLSIIPQGPQLPASGTASSPDLSTIAIIAGIGLAAYFIFFRK